MTKEIQFESENIAEMALRRAGFALGNMQRDDPRGILFGNYDIQKWRNLDGRDKAELHGTYTRVCRGGPVNISLADHCPCDPAAHLLELSKPQ